MPNKAGVIYQAPRKSRGLSRSLNGGDMVWAIPVTILFIGLFSYLDHLEHVARDEPYAAFSQPLPRGCQVTGQPEVVAIFCDRTINDLTWQNTSRRYGLPQGKGHPGHWLRLGNDATQVLCGKDRSTCGVVDYVHGKFFEPTAQQLSLLRSSKPSSKRISLGKQGFGYPDMF
jgi:hypothetical protein